MKCRYCSCLDSRVVDSRPSEDGTAIRRRRECTCCGKRFTTYEKIEEIPMMVVKRDGTRQEFSPEKILSGVRKACEKRPVSTAEMNELVENVTKEVYNSLDQEVTTITIGELVMKYLLELDEVAYVRFASVYRSFKDINTFMQELKNLLGDDAKKIKKTTQKNNDD
ncbi:MAG: transcriptional repressor NrdR [Clostridia bacterium]|nr:transcriptional repressor NrdR [Clostridia bacterium]